MGRKEEEGWRWKDPEMGFFFTHIWIRENFHLLLDLIWNIHLIWNAHIRLGAWLVCPVYLNLDSPNYPEPSSAHLNSIPGCLSVCHPEKIGQGPIQFWLGLKGTENWKTRKGAKILLLGMYKHRAGVAESQTCHSHRARAGRVGRGEAD